MPNSPMTYEVEVVWQNVQTTAIQFDISTFGEGDRFTDPFAIDWNDPTAEVIPGVSSININRGRDDNLAFYSMGECTITIEDATGTYNPANESSPLYGKTRPMRPIRVTSSFGASGVTLFTGFIRSIEFSATDGNRGVATIIACDLFLNMSKTNPVFTNVGRDTTTGEVLNSVMSGIGYTGTTLWSNADGDVIPSPGVGNSSTGQSALQIAASLMEIERGDFFINFYNEPTFYERNRRAVQASLFTFTDVGTRVAATTDLDRVKNKAAVVKQTDVGDFTSDWSDGPSIANYGQQDFSTISSFYIYDAAQAQALAQWLVSQRSSPTSTLRSLEIIPRTFDDADRVTILGLCDLAEKITVEETSTGLPPTDFFVESIKHSITPELHRMSFGLVKDDALALVLDSATNGLLDTNTLAY